MRPFGVGGMRPFWQLESLGEVEQDMAMDVDANGKPVRPASTTGQAMGT